MREGFSSFNARVTCFFPPLFCYLAFFIDFKKVFPNKILNMLEKAAQNQEKEK